MKKLSLLLCLSVSLSFSALPPQVQADKDRTVMQKFVQTHTLVSSTLIAIDVRHKEVHFGKNCVAKFVRKITFHLPGWVGPAADLVFESSNCKID